MKKALASVLAVVMLLMCIPLGAVSVSAVSASQYAPYAQIEYGYTTNVSYGTVRYMSQIAGSSYFYDAYWGSWKSQAGIECGTCSISMSLSYIGVSKTPKEILDYGKGETYFGYNWGGAQVKSCTYANLSTAVDNYAKGNGKYSPPVIHLNKYSSAGHFVVLVGQISANQYQVLDPANSSLWSITISGSSAQYKHPSTGATISDTIDRSGRSDDIYQWYNPDATPNLIKETYRSCCVVKVTKATTIKSLPCSKETDPNSADVETPKVGDYYKAIALHRNTTKAGNLWYEVETKSGGTGYLFAGNTEYYGQSTSDVALTGAAVPTTIKHEKVFIIKGTISAKYQTLVGVAAWVDDPNGEYVMGDMEQIKALSYSLEGSKLDDALTFNSLGVGKYYYCVAATVETYYAKDATTVSTKRQTVDLHESAFNVVKDTACQHSYNSTVKTPTCTEGGYTTYTCTLCGYAYDDNHTNALGCDYETAVTKPSCTGQGYTTAVCRRCGKTETGNYVDPTGHMYDILEIPATCTQPGKRCYTCAFCGDYYEETVTSYVSEWSTEYPDVDDSAIIESKQQYRHRRWQESTNNSLAGWTYYDSYTCLGEYGAWSSWDTDAITGNDNTQVETRTAYTYYYYKCPGCGAHMHGWGITCPTWAGGCGKATIRSSDYVWVYSTTSYTAAGLKDFYGTGKYYATVDGVRAFQHSNGQVTQYRSRTRAVETVYRFYNDSDWEDTLDSSATLLEERTVYRYILAQTARHTYSGQETTAATCGADGLMTYTCIACGDSYTESIPATGDHTYDDDYDAYCNTCGGIREVPEKPPVTPDLPADAPAFVVESVTACEGEEITIAIRTQRNSGIVSLCLEVAYDADVLELISLEEGDFANVVLSPTTRNPFIANWADAINPNNTTDGIIVLATFRVKEGAPLGKTEITLTYDSEDVYDQNFDNVGFRVENGYVEVVDYVAGDVNEDGRINNKDLGLLQQYLAGFEVSVNQRAADVNADGRVNNKDLGLLQQYLAGFEVELG